MFLLVFQLAAGEKPMDEILVAAVCAHDDPSLALTALAHARAAGGASSMIDFIATIASSCNLQFEEALAFGSVAMKARPDDAWLLAPTMRIASLASFRWKMALDVTARYPAFQIHPVNPPDNSTDAVQEMIRGFSALPADEMSNPVAEFSTLAFHDHAGHLASGTYPDAPQSNAIIDDLNHNRPVLPAAPDGLMNCVAFGPAGANVDFSSTCHFQASDDHRSELGKAYCLILFDQQSNWGCAELELFETGLALLYGRGNVPLYRLDLTKAAKDDKEFKVRLCAVGDRCEIVLNGSRIFYGPLLPDEKTRQLSVVNRWQGIKGQMKDVSWRTAGPGGHGL